jgi:hypothetical protein
MTIRLTAAQARDLGLDLEAAPAKKPRTTRRTVKGAPYYTICTNCGFESRTQAAEDRHLADNPTHRRYEIARGL